MRSPSQNDYLVPVEKLGTFTFARRTLADEIAIQVERSKILDGTIHPTDFLWNIAVWMSALRVLMVSAPRDFDLEALDPLEQGTFDTISSIFVEMRKKEDSFRAPRGTGSEVSSENDSENGRVLVPAEVQPTA